MPAYDGVAVVILGASGFIGRRVDRKLAEAGARIRRIGREDAADLESAYRNWRPSITFNLAGYGIDPAERDETTAFRVNAELPGRLAEAAAAWRDPAWPGQHLVHAGTAAEYGSAGGALPEDGPASPTTLYGRSKWRGTQAVAERSHALGLRGLTARLFTVYGPGERAGRLLPSLLDARRTGLPVRLSSGLQRRDFTYVEDVAEGLLRLGLTTGESGIVNLATGRLTTVRTFAEIAAGILGIPARNLQFGAIPPSAHEMEHEGVTVDRLQQLLGWVPRTTIADGVRKTMETSLLEKAEL